jgi:glycosyltransferase involved in cell wall biosynthesis
LRTKKGYTERRIFSVIWYNEKEMISTIILTKNSAATLSDTLSSVQWCDEIIVIDDYSTDDTENIAATYNAIVKKKHLHDDFSAQRNFGLEQAAGEWVLFVDSDERVSEELKQEIRGIISQKGDREQPVGYYLKRDDIFLGGKLRFGETAHVKLLRLAKKNAGRWIRPVHEYWDIKGDVQTLHNPLVHTAHKTIAGLIKKINWYTTINAKYLFEQNVHANVGTILLYPFAKFVWNYIFLLGFLDGTRGMIMAIFMSFHSFLTRAKLYLLFHAA